MLTVQRDPTDCTSEISFSNLITWSLVLCVCALQNADPVKRQRGFHVEREEPWEHTFNFSIILQPAVLLFADWCTSDVSPVTLSSSSPFLKWCTLLSFVCLFATAIPLV